MLLDSVAEQFIMSSLSIASNRNRKIELLTAEYNLAENEHKIAQAKHNETGKNLAEAQARKEEASKKLVEELKGLVADLLPIQPCPQCGMTNDEAREVGMDDAGFEKHKEKCKFRERKADYEKWRGEGENLTAKEIKPTKKPKLNKKAYEFVCNCKQIKHQLTGARLEECQRLFEGTIYLDWISQSEEGEGTEEEDLTASV